MPYYLPNQWLSYDIIKAHGGEIRVESKEGEGCEFIIQLPV
jgi:signal transduction histidine kinase